MGYGKGHYDKALARLDKTGSRLALGVAFSVQEVEVVPAEPHDRRLDAILTETGFRAP
ncbi:5-formyltetrahydrofolate cyclo-ligase [Acinetobacter baumannii]